MDIQIVKKLSIIVPVYNEQEVLPEFYLRICAVLDNLNMDTEILFINDGSKDSSLSLISELADNDHRVSYINLSRNFGKESAMSAGIEHVDADLVVIIDADLQDPPELILEMIHLYEKGYDTVYGQRQERHGETWLKKKSASYFYRLIQNVSRVNIPQDTGDFRLLSRRSIEALRKLPENNRFMKGIFAWIGYPQVALPYTREARVAGNTKFNYWKLWNFALDGITSFTTLPLKMASYVGLIVALSSFFYGGYIITCTLFFGDPVAGFPTLATLVLFLGGVQLLFLGIIGEYMGRMFDETKRRPLYLIEKVHKHSNN